MPDVLNDLGTTTLWRPAPNWREVQEWGFEIERQLLEFEGTSHELTKISTATPHRLAFLVTLDGKAEEYDLIQQFVTFRGRLKKFWFPHPASLFDVMQDPPDSGTYKLKDWNFGGDERVYIERKNGDFFTQKVSFVDPDWVVTWAIPDGAARVVSLLPLMRLENDALDVEYLSSALAEVKLSMVELVQEYGEV